MSRATAFIAFSVLLLIVISGCGGGSSPIIPSDEVVEETHWISTTDGVGMHSILHRMPDASSTHRYPGLLLIPGGMQAGDAWHSRARKSNAWEFTKAGFVVLIYDARGRGWSAGVEDYDGKIHQDDLAKVIDWFNKQDVVAPGGIGIATSSWGITVAAGAISRHPDLDVRFIVDLEGSDDRFTMTQWDDPKWVQIMDGHDTSDDAFWADREAIKYMGDLNCPYFRVQSDFDHALDMFYFDHAIRLVNAAVDGGCPYARLNDMTPNQIYDLDKIDEYHWWPINSIDGIFFKAVTDALDVTEGM